MSALVLKLDAVSAADADKVGSKAANLGALRAAGFPVPVGVCLTSAAFGLAFEPLAKRIDVLLAEHRLDTPSGAAAAAEALATLLDSLTVPGGVREAAQPDLDSWFAANTPLAVRSSATAEDRADASFAGQYDSVLGVRGEAAFWAAVLQCWRSFFSAHALTARAAAGALASHEAMAVLVQPIIDAECAGTCFSVDPRGGETGRIVVEAAWGLGVGAVDGNVETDSAELDRQSLKTLARRVVQKSRCVGLTDDGIAPAEVPEERRRAACLPEAWLRRLGEFALTVEQRLGGPQDIEWAIADGRLWLLQSRPITTLAPERVPAPFPASWSDPTDARLAWRRDVSETEALPLPLVDEVEDAFSDARTEAAYRNGDDHLTRRRRFDGWPYVAHPPTPLGEGDRRVRKAIARERGRLLWESETTSWQHRAPDVVPTVERLARFDFDAAGGPELAEHLEDAFGAFRLHWCVHWLGLGEEFRRTYREVFAKVSGLEGEEAERAGARLLEGEETILTQMIDRLYALAQTAAQQPSLRAYLQHTADPSVAEMAELGGTEAFAAA